MILVLLGPPGAGKGTQAQVLSQETGLAHVSSGDIFRENLKNKTELGKKAQIFVDSGELVPDDITIGMIRERLARPDCQKGVLLDGFPRTPAQAATLPNAFGNESAGQPCALYFCPRRSPDRTLKRSLDLPGRRACLSPAV